MTSMRGVLIGVITSSYRSMPDQSAEVTLQYVVEDEINALELMKGRVWDYAQKKRASLRRVTAAVAAEAVLRPRARQAVQ